MPRYYTHIYKHRNDGQSDKKECNQGDEKFFIVILIEFVLAILTSIEEEWG